jgi:hypothetical protein
MIVDTGSSYKRGGAVQVDQLSFGAKVASSLNGVDPSFVNSVAGSY